MRVVGGCMCVRTHVCMVYMCVRAHVYVVGEWVCMCACACMWCVGGQVGGRVCLGACVKVRGELCRLFPTVM